jgi:DNA-binding MarR family transcriptional regulator
MRSMPEFACACATARRTARAITQMYSREMRGLMDPPQFALLSMVEKRPECSQMTLVHALALDKTTLSRNLNLMERKRWIEPVAAGDGRERGFRLTPEGRSRLNAAKPAWTRAQQRLRSAVGEAEWGRMFQVLNTVAMAAASGETNSKGGAGV